jgi:site-specific DNA-methyltransferase (adenine-specific)
MRLIKGDCLEEMKGIADGSVDMVLCDLPYGTTACKWDSVIPFEPLWAHYKRVIKKNGAIVLTASQPFTSQLGASNLKMLKYAWVWEKSSVTGHLNAHHMPMKKHEDVLVFYAGRVTYKPQGLIPYQKVKKRGSNGKNFGVSGTENYQESTNYPRSILQFNNDGKLHPTQKPVTLMEYLIRTYTNKGETVLDNTMGSGTTGVACVNTGREFIGIEMDDTYFEIAKERIEKAKMDKLMELDIKGV